MTDTRVAIVTGASRGIGAAIAERLGRDGFTEKGGAKLVHVSGGMVLLRAA